MVIGVRDGSVPVGRRHSDDLKLMVGHYGREQNGLRPAVHGSVARGSQGQGLKR